MKSLLDQESADAVADTLQGVLAEAIRGALIDVAVGPNGASAQLSPEEEALVEQYRRSPEHHRAAAHRVLGLTAPVKE